MKNDSTTIRIDKLVRDKLENIKGDLSHNEFVEHLIKLQDLNLRKELSKESLKTCNQLFSREVFDSLILDKIKGYVRH